MSQWSQVQQLEIKFLEQVDQFYDDNFPMEVRHLLAQWIESQDWEAASNNEPMATILLQNLLIQLDEQLDRVSQEKNLLLIHNLKRIRKLLQRGPAYCYCLGPRTHSHSMVEVLLHHSTRGILSAGSYIQEECLQWR